jgi:hypothetical protein
MAETVTSPDEQVFPPRFWWLKRITAAMLVLAGLLVGLRYLALHVAKRRLAAEIAAIKARGEPLAPQDFADRLVSPQDDAGPDLLGAMKMFAVPPQHLAAWKQLRPFDLTSNNNATADAVLSANRQALAKVRAARDKPVLNWGFSIQQHGQTVPLIEQLRQLCQALAVAAQRALTDLRHAEAVEYLRDWLMVTRSLENQPYLVSEMLATSFQEPFSKCVYSWAPSIAIGNSQGAASEAQVRALIAELLNEKTGRSGLQWAWQGERMRNMHLVEALASEDTARSRAMGWNIQVRFLGWWKRPMQVAIAEDLLALWNVSVKEAGAKDLLEASRILAESKSPPRRYNQLIKMASQRGGTLQEQFQAVHDRRKAAIALAARMFRLKYQKEATDIRQLVPEFLPDVPLDPLKGNGQTMIVD